MTLTNDIIAGKAVHETKDYEMFNFMQGNRSIDPQNLKRIMQSMSENYLVSPITVNEKNEIIDGQHRYTAAKALDLPIRFIVCKNYGLNEVQTLNSNSKNWNTVDYLNSFCELGYEEYHKVRLFMNQFPEFTVSSAIALLSAGKGTRKEKKTAKMNTFNTGAFKVTDWQFAARTAREIMDLSPYTSLYKNRSFLVAYIGVRKNKNFKPAVFKEKVKKYAFMIEPRTNVTEYKTLFESIYNYRNRNKVSIIY